VHVLLCWCLRARVCVRVRDVDMCRGHVELDVKDVAGRGRHGPGGITGRHPGRVRVRSTLPVAAAWRRCLVGDFVEVILGVKDEDRCGRPGEIRRPSRGCRLYRLLEVARVAMVHAAVWRRWLELYGADGSWAISWRSSSAGGVSSSSLRSAAREKNIWNSSELSWDPISTGVAVETGAGTRRVPRLRRRSSSCGDKVMLKSCSTVSAARGASKHERGFDVMIRAPGASWHRR